MNSNGNKDSVPGKLFVVSAPSGAGKTTLCTTLLLKFPRISYSVSHTTRKPRKDEEHGKDYYFISIDDFENKIKNNFWVEWAKVHGNYYGTSRRHLAGQLEQGMNVLLEIDIKGAKQIKKIFPGAVTIFIMPPSTGVLEERLRSRATDTDEIIELRLKNARAEMDQKHFYDYIVVNNDLDMASREICNIVRENL